MGKIGDALANLTKGGSDEDEMEDAPASEDGESASPEEVSAMKMFERASGTKEKADALKLFLKAAGAC